MAKCMIYWDVKIQAYQLKMTGDYQRTMKTVEFLKKAIPHSDRSWDPDAKIWTFVEKYLDGVKQFCVLCFGQQEVACLNKQQVEGSSQQAISNQKISGIELTMLDFMKLLPFEAAQKAYRAASMILHPDKGGDMEKMTKLNQCWSRLEKEVYK